MLKRKNSSLNVLVDSTSSIVRNASSAFQCLIGSARRASYCGQPDPSVQLGSNGTSGSLYLRPSTADSNESSLSNASYDELRRTVTIYDGRIPATPVPPPIPFELITPIEAITKAVDDPVESFVQIVLEAPDDKPPIMPPIPTSPQHMSTPTRRRHRSISPMLTSNSHRSSHIIENSALPKLTQHHSTPTTDAFNEMRIHCVPPDIVEPMDFSFLEPVLRGESAAPPPMSVRNQSLSLSKNHTSRRISHQYSSTPEDSAIDLHIPSCSSYSSTAVTNHDDDLTSSESLSGDNHNYSVPPSPRWKMKPSIE